MKIGATLIYCLWNQNIFNTTHIEQNIQFDLKSAAYFDTYLTLAFAQSDFRI